MRAGARDRLSLGRRRRRQRRRVFPRRQSANATRRWGPAEAPTVELDAPKPQMSRRRLRFSPRESSSAHSRGGASQSRTIAPRAVPSSSGSEQPGRASASEPRRGVRSSGVTALRAGKDAARSLCGRAYARLESGRLPDPRLDLAGCVTATGDTVAFAWLAPGPHTSFVAVRQQGYVEIYPVVARVPVRISSTGNISTQRSRAMFEVLEHDASGALLHSSILEARVAVGYTPAEAARA